MKAIAKACIKSHSNLVFSGHYVFESGIFGCIDQTPPGINKVIQLTDAMKLLEHKAKMHVSNSQVFGTTSETSWISKNQSSS